MTGFLLDTNVISELTRDTPDAQVVSFLSRHDDVWLPAVLMHEIEYGLRLLPQGRRRDRLAEMQSAILSTYEDRILSLDRAGAEWSAEFRARAHLAGHTLDLGDALIAGTAKAHDLAVATRNIADFGHLDVDVVNPWGPQ